MESNEVICCQKTYRRIVQRRSWGDCLRSVLTSEYPPLLSGQRGLLRAFIRSKIRRFIPSRRRFRSQLKRSGLQLVTSKHFRFYVRLLFLFLVLVVLLFIAVIWFMVLRNERRTAQDPLEIVPVAQLTDQQHDLLLDGLAQRRPALDEQLQLRVQRWVLCISCAAYCAALRKNVAFPRVLMASVESVQLHLSVSQNTHNL